jgi:hypothetical protein
MNYSVENTIELYEDYDRNSLDIIIENFDDLYYLIGKFKDYKNSYKVIEDKNRCKTILQNLAKSKKVIYKPSTTCPDGRLFGANSLQGINKIIRHTLCKGYYYDYDIVNCHNVLLQWYCKEKEIPLVNLNEYNENRERYLYELMETFEITREESKTIVLSMINGGGDGWLKQNGNPPPKWLIDLNNELKNVLHEICKLNPELYKKNLRKKDKFNPTGSTINMILCKMENIVIQCFWKWCQNNNFQVGTLCFDGLLLKNKIDCNEIENYIKSELGIDLQITEKEMDKNIDLTSYEKKNTYDYSKVDYYIEQLEQEIDYDNIYSYQQFINKTCNIEQIEKLFKNTIIRMLNGGKNPSFITKKKEWNNYLQKYNYMYTTNINIIWLYSMMSNPTILKTDERSLRLLTKKEREKYNKPFVSTTLKDVLADMLFQNKIDWVDGFVFEPYFNKPPLGLENKFNLFTKFELMEDNIYFDTKTTNFEQSAIYNHIVNHLCNGVEIQYNYVLDGIAHMIQKPNEKTDQCTLFCSEQGGFKDGFHKFLSLLIGSQYSIGYINIDNFFKGFNKDQESKLLITINEIAEGSSDSAAFKRHNELKGRITQQELRIEPKGVDPYNVKDYARYFTFTNHERSLMVENSDRRYVMIKSNNEKCNDTVYFKPLFDSLDDIDFMKNAFSYFAMRDISQFDNHKGIESEFKNEQKLNCLSSTLTFIKDFWTNGEHEIDDDFRIHTGDLYELFVLYCNSFGIGRPVKRLTFVEQLKRAKIFEKTTQFTYNINDIGVSFDKLHYPDYKTQKTPLAELLICIADKRRLKNTKQNGYDLSRSKIKECLEKYLRIDNLEM